MTNTKTHISTNAPTHEFSCFVKTQIKRFSFTGFSSHRGLNILHAKSESL